MIIALSQYLLVPLLFGFLVWIPVPYGSATPAAVLTARLVSCLAALLAAVGWTGRHRIRGSVPALIALVGLSALALVQSAPWPRTLAAKVSPAHAKLEERSREVARLGEPEPSVALSLAPDLSRRAAATLLSLVFFFFAASVVGSRSRPRRWLLWGIGLGGITQLLIGIRPWLAGEVPRVRGTFVNADHLALYLEISLCVFFALVCWAIRRSRSEEAFERRLLLVGPAVLVWLLFFVGLVATGSRAGLVAGVVGLTVQAILLAVAWRRSRLLLAGAGGLIIAAAAIGLVGFQRGLGRMLATSWHAVATSDRVLVWRESLELIRSFPATGTGLGTFGEAFPMVQPPELADWVWTRAHNDFLELVITGGVLGSGIVLVGLVGLILGLWKVLRRGLRAEDRLTALAALGAVAAVSVHEVFDFGATLPANAYTLTILLGSAAASRLSEHS
jgi:O-antigen ligase